MRSLAVYLMALTTCACASARAAGVTIDPNNLNTKIDPRADFYHYANGGWFNATKIPADYARWGTFEELQENVQAVLHDIVDVAAADPKPEAGSIKQKVGDFYASGMDTAAIEAAGAKPLAELLALVGTVNDTRSLASVLAALQTQGTDAAFGFGARPDDKNSTMVIAQVYQGGLGLPERDYYFADDKAEIRAAYVKHIEAMLTLIGDADAQANAKAVMALETELAKVSFTAVERRDPERTYNKRSLGDLLRSHQAFAWNTFFAGIGLPQPGDINIENPNFVEHLGELAHTLDTKQWQAYLRWHVAASSAMLLSEAFVNESFHFYGTVLQGTEELRPRWKRVLSTTDGMIGEALGQLYVAQKFPPEAKEHAARIVGTLRDALRERLRDLPWMQSSTRTLALKKLGTFNVKIGYPDKWIDYTPLHIDRSSFANNVHRAEKFLFAREVARIGKPVDRTRWEMNPQTVNAYYDPQLNEIVFPAAILQPPFFDPSAEDAFNYGGMGAVIGHEMTHGYDDQGRQYDAEGNMKDWWTTEDAAEFKRRAARIITQFGGYRIFDHPLNGQLTQGENIADLGGLKVAYLAWRNTNPNMTKVHSDGFTSEQHFFFAWAGIWRNQVRREAALQRLATDPHAPGEWRVNGPLSNMLEFYDAFNVRETDPMFRSNDVRVTIW